MLAAAALLISCAVHPTRATPATPRGSSATWIAATDVPTPQSGSASDGNHRLRPKAKGPLILPAADVADLASGSADNIVRAAFLGEGAPGALLVRGVPGYAAARVAALAGLAKCAGVHDSPLRRSDEWDEAHGGRGAFSRATVAAGASARLPGTLDRSCGSELRPLLETLRAAADAAAAASLTRLDDLLGYDTGGFFASAAASEGSLDHFHVYQPSNPDARAADPAEPNPSSSSSREEVEGGEPADEDSEDFSSSDSSPGLRGKGEHTDVGVAIVMTPALLVSLSPGGSDGSVAPEPDAFGSRGLSLGGRAPELPPDALVVMLGEAARAWLPPPPPDMSPVPPPLAVPSHEMSLSLTTGTRTSRAWFGRMVLPPAATVHPTAPGGITFGAWHEGANAAFGNAARNDGDGAARAEAAAVSCSPRRILADDASCGAGKVYCWLSCVDAPACGTGEEPKCVQQSTGKLWPEDLGAKSHCNDCQATCRAVPSPPPLPAHHGNHTAGSPPPSPERNEFCNDKIPPASMYMDGFLAWKDPNVPCVAYLHKNFALTSPGKLVGATFLTILMGVAVEALAAGRRWRHKTQDAVVTAAARKGGDGAGRMAATMCMFQTLALYTVQCAAGYLLMLVSMTYHAVLFCGVVAGLVIGHWMFNAAYPSAGGGASACCQHIATVPGVGIGGDDSSDDLVEGLVSFEENFKENSKSCCNGEEEKASNASVIEIRQ